MSIGKSTLLLGFLLLASTASWAQGLPNIVVFIGDDHGWDQAGFMDHPYALTPNLDALAASGTVFTNAHNTASVCRPSLRTFLSGLHSSQWDLRRQAIVEASGPVAFRRESAHVRTLPRELSRRGYVSFEGGKFWEGTYLDGGFTAGMAETVPSNFYSSVGDDFGRVGIDAFRDFLDTTGDDPFVVWLAPMLPHSPFNAAVDYTSQFQGLGLSNVTIQYLANVLWMDDVLGEVQEELESRGLHENTLVVYASDNGWELGSPGAALGGQSRGKTSIYEQGFRTSLIFSQPGALPAGVVREDLVSIIDLFPTLLDVAKLPNVPGRWGESLLPHILSGQPVGAEILAGRASVKLNGQPPAVPHHFVRGLDWRYIRKSDGTEEVYEINEDPFELNNVITQRPDVLPAARTAVLDFETRLHQPAAILDAAGRVVDSAGDPLVGIRLSLKGRDDSGRRWKLRTLTDRAGYFRFTNLPHGNYLITGRQEARDFSYFGETQRRLPVRLPWAQHGAYLPLVAELRPTASPWAEVGEIGLHGQVVDEMGEPVAGAVLSTSLGRGRWLDVVSGADGKFYFEGLKSGTVRILTRGAALRRRNVSVLNLESALPDALEIRVERRL